MSPIFKYILLLGIRDRLYLGLFLALISAFCVSVFFGNTAVIEKQQMAIAYMAGAARAILAVGMILFVCLNVSRAFENKEVEFILSKSISRQQFILGYLCGFFAAAFIILLVATSLISCLAKINPIGLVAWLGSMLCEMLILISFALLSSLILKNSFSAILASFAFYLISRLMGVVVFAINLPQDLTAVKSNFLGSALKIFSAIFPRLDLFSQSSWLYYGIDSAANLNLIFLQSAIYIPLMIFMAFHDFKKKQF
jgi:Cu-processing system permease protein